MKTPPYKRYSTECTSVKAALSYLYPRKACSGYFLIRIKVFEASGFGNTFNLLFIHKPVDNTYNILIMRCSYNGIDFRHLLKDIVRIALRKASGNDDLTDLPLFLEICAGEDRIYRFLFC